MRKKIVIVGAGPGGIAAAVTAAENGAEVTIIDENPGMGGQIWRQQLGKVKDKNAKSWINRLNNQQVKFCSSTVVLSSENNLLICNHSENGRFEIEFDSLIFACGAKELFLPFPGWTLPNVLGCGGAQAMVKSGLSVQGKKVVVSGSGPLLLAVAYFLKKQGAKVVGIFEQAEGIQLNKLALSLAFSYPSKLIQGAVYRLGLLSVPWKKGWWVKEASGSKLLEQVIATNGRTDMKIDCDILSCGFGLKANTELPGLLGCSIKNDFIEVDEFQKTSVDNIFAVGELTGIGGLDKALLEGQNAANNAIGKAVVSNLKKTQVFVNKLDAAFSLRREVKELADEDTVFCRCEGVSYKEVSDCKDQRTAKLYSRCGMGPCQGRVCSTMGRELFGWELNKIKSPLIPLKIDSLIE